MATPGAVGSGAPPTGSDATAAVPLQFGFKSAIKDVLTSIFNKLMEMVENLWTSAIEALLNIDPNTLGNLQNVYGLSMFAFFTLMTIFGLSFLGLFQLFPGSQKLDPYRFLTRAFAALLSIFVVNPAIITSGSVDYTGFGGGLFAWAIMLTNDIQNMFLAGIELEMSLEAAGGAFVLAVLIIAMGSTILLGTLLFMMMLVLREVVVFLTFALYPLLIAFWVVDVGPLKYGKQLSEQLFKATGMLLAAGVVIAGSINAAFTALGQSGDAQDHTTSGAAADTTVVVTFSDGGNTDFLIAIAFFLAVAVIGITLIYKPLAAVGIDKVASAAKGAAGAAAGAVTGGAATAATGASEVASQGMNAAKNQLSTGGSGGGGPDVPGSGNSLMDNTVSADRNKAVSTASMAADGGGGRTEYANPDSSGQTTLRDYGGDVPEQAREPGQDQFDLAGMSEYEYRHMDEDARKAAGQQLVDEGHFEELSDAVDAVGETTTMDYLKSGGKKATLKSLAKGGAAVGVGALGMAGVSIASGGTLAPAAIGGAMLKGGAIGFGAGVAKQGIQHHVPKDYRSLEGLTNEVPKDLSNAAGRVSDGFDDLSDSISGGSSYAEGTTGDETGSDQTDVLQDQSTLDDVAKELEKENE